MYKLNEEQKAWFDHYCEILEELVISEETIEQARAMGESEEFKHLFGNLTLDEAWDIYEFPDSFENPNGN